MDIFGYAARMDGTQVFLGNSSQMDEYLGKGASIYLIYNDWSEKLIATPEDGYLVDKPVFP